MAAPVERLSAHEKARSDTIGDVERRTGAAAADAYARDTLWSIGGREGRGEGGAHPKHSQLHQALVGGSSSKDPWQIFRSLGTQEPKHSL